MSEAATRPVMARGRGSARGARGGGRGGTRGRDRQQLNGAHKDMVEVEAITDEGELGEMKKQYKSQLPMLKELFEDWNDVDLMFALQETNGDLESTIDRISEGHVSKFSDVKSSKEKSKPKAKESSPGFLDAAASTRPARGRGGFDTDRGASRGIRGDRGGDRGRGRGRGPSHMATNGTRAPAPSIPIASDSTAWNAQPAAETSSSWDTPASTEAPPKPVPTAAAAAPRSSKQPVIRDGGPKKTWAQMFAPPLQDSAPIRNVPESAPTPETGMTPSETSSDFVHLTHADAAHEDLFIPPIADDPPIHESPDTSDLHEPTITLIPSKDQLTQENVEHLPDTAHPAPVGTAASTVESSRGLDSMSPSLVGHNGAQAPIGRPVLGGYATTAYKATAAPGRTPSFQRRLMEQHEAVVMPGNHQVDRTAVQFGSLGLNGDADVDEDREEAETRAQPPGHSPVAAPRASLPPIPRQPAAPAEQDVPKAAPGLPPAPQQQQPFAQQSPGQLTSQASQQTGQYNQFGRYGQAAAEPTSLRAYDPFGQQNSQQNTFDGYGSHSQAPSQPSQAQSHLPGFSSGPPDYSQYYTADQRHAYQNYYNSYGQPSGAAQQDAGASQPRTGSAFGAAGESAFATSQAQQSQSRYNDAQHSGHNTPNPPLGAQQQAGAPSQQGQHMQQQGHTQQGQHGAYPYQNPYFNSPYYSAYLNQYSPYTQNNFGAPYAAKGGMYHQQPHHGGYSQNAYDQHSSSPANAGSFGGRESTLTSGLNDFARSGSAQPSHSQQQSGAGAFGGMNDPFSRAQGAFASQAAAYGQQQSGQQGANEDALKPFSDSKSGGGPNASALGQPGRPGSAANTMGQSTQSGLPPPQSHQQGFGSYPGGHHGQMGQTSQYGGGLGGLGSGHTTGAQNHQGGYGNYGAGAGGAGAGAGAGFSGSYGSYGRGGGTGGGWGGNYGH